MQRDRFFQLKRVRREGIEHGISGQIIGIVVDTGTSTDAPNATTNSKCVAVRTNLTNIISQEE